MVSNSIDHGKTWSKNCDGSVERVSIVVGMISFCHFVDANYLNVDPGLYAAPHPDICCISLYNLSRN